MQKYTWDDVQVQKMYDGEIVYSICNFFDGLVADFWVNDEAKAIDGIIYFPTDNNIRFHMDNETFPGVIDGAGINGDLITKFITEVLNAFNMKGF